MKFDELAADEPQLNALVIVLRELDIAHRAMLRRVECDLNLSRVEYFALAAAVDDGGITPKRLSAAIGLTTGATTAALDRLEAADYLRRAPNPADRRSIIVRATARGEAAIAGVYASYLAAVQRATGAMPGDRVDQLVASVGSVVRELEAQPQPTAAASSAPCVETMTLQLVG
jgi:DNA-binding MarR family transcriptional regulator